MQRRWRFSELLQPESCSISCSMLPTLVTAWAGLKPVQLGLSVLCEVCTGEEEGWLAMEFLGPKFSNSFEDLKQCNWSLAGGTTQPLMVAQTSSK
jgi:hypothetical protein